MALQASTATAGPSGTAGTWPTVSAHSRALVFVSEDGTGASVTPPTGFTFVGKLTVTGPDSQSLVVFEKKDCTGAESGNINITSSGIANTVVQAVTLTGRSNTAALTFSTSTPNTTSNTSPISMGAASGTAAAGDDLVSFFSVDQTVAAAVWNYAPPSGWTELQDNHDTQWTSGASSINAGVAAGAVGTVTSVATRTSGTGNGGWGAWIVAVPAAPSTTQETGLFLGNPTLLM